MPSGYSVDSLPGDVSLKKKHAMEHKHAMPTTISKTVAIIFKTPTSRLGHGRQIKCGQREPELLHRRVRDDGQGWTVLSRVYGHHLLQNLPVAKFVGISFTSKNANSHGAK